MRTIKELVKDNHVKFSRYRQGVFYYTIKVLDTTVPLFPVYDDYEFPVPIEDIGTGTLLSEDKALTYMRWIRKAMEDKTLVKV